MTEVEVKSWGNSLGIILPAEEVRQFGLKKGDRISIDVVAKRRVDAFGIAKGAKPFEEEPFEHEDIA